MYIRIESAEEEEDAILTDSEVQRYLSFFKIHWNRQLPIILINSCLIRFFVFFLTSISQMIGHEDSNYIRFLVVQYFAH